MDAREFHEEVLHYRACRELPARVANLEHLDEILVFFVRTAGDSKARDELLLRHQARIRKLLARLGSRAGLAKEDLEDANQEAVFWALEAIAKFDSIEFFLPKTRRFHEFLDLLVKSRFANFVRGARRQERHYLDQEPQTWAVTREGHSESPSTTLESAEIEERLDEAVARLPDSLREIVVAIRAGQSLHDVAATLHTSYRTIKRRWQEARAVLGRKFTSAVLDRASHGSTLLAGSSRLSLGC